MAGMLAAITVPVIPLLASGSVGAQDSSDLAAQVDRIQARRAELDDKLSILDEEANQAKLKLADLEKRAATNQADVDSAKGEMAGASKDVRSYAIKTFTASPGTEMMGGEVDPTSPPSRAISMTPQRRSRPRRPRPTRLVRRPSKPSPRWPRKSSR